MMSELKIKYSEDSEFKCIRRIATKLGLSMPESDDEVLNLSQFRRIERAISEEFESLLNLTAISTKHATRADELSEKLEQIVYCSDNNTGHEPSLSCFQRAIDEARNALNKSRD